MEQKQHKHGLGSFVWVIPLLIGFGFAVVIMVVFIREALEGFPTEPIQWDSVGGGLMWVALLFPPFALVSWFLWARRGKKIPSLAFVVTLVIGVFLFWYSLPGCIGGFADRPIVWTTAVGGLMEITKSALPFFAVAWLLWFRPKIGAIVLICVGAAIGVWMGFAGDFWTLDGLLPPPLLAGLPIILGVHTLIRETASSRILTCP